MWELLDRQLGVARTAQVLDLGVSKDQLRSMARRGELEKVCYGIIRARGSNRCWEQQVQIGILLASSHRVKGFEAGACGETAAVLLDLGENREGVPIHILTRRRVTPRPDYCFHWTSRLPEEELTVVGGLLCTDAVRTFLDICAADPGWARWMYRRGLRKGVLAPEAVERRVEVEARQGRSGVVVARRILEETSETAHKAKSGWEDVYHDYLVRAAYPPPLRNVSLPGSFGHPWEVDLYYPQIRKGFEISPSETHWSPESHERDGRKELDLKARGIDIIRITERLSFEEFISRIRPVLGPSWSFPCQESGA
jgi:hypothetical protein